MIITATEFKTNVSRYLALAENQEIMITKNGRSIAKLVGARDGGSPMLRSMRGILKDADVSKDSIKDERLAKYDEGVD